MINFIRLLLFVTIAIFTWRCSSTEANNISSNNSKGSANTRKLSEEEIEECKNYQSYQYDYWKNRNYRRVIYCNMYMMDMNCDNSPDYQVNYYNLSRSFIEIENSQTDSAFWALKQGLREDGNNGILLELGAYLSHKTNNIDKQVYYLDKVI